MRIIKDFQFRNWAGNAQCRPEKYFQPQSESEIIGIVKEAADAGKKIRVVGAGHSWSPVVCTDDYMINLDFYNSVIRIDKDKRQITVQAGIRLKQLNKILEDNGMGLVNLGSVSEQSIAGATATGTHGTGIGFQILSSAIIGMRVINAGGKVVEIDEQNPLINAYRVSLGMLGVVSEVTLQCTDDFCLREDSAPMQFDKALDLIPELLQENDHVKFWWFPHVDHLMAYRFQRTHDKAQQQSEVLKWIEGVLIANYFFAFLLRIGAAFPSWIPSTNRFIKTLHLKKIIRTGKSCDIFNVPMPPKHRESEYAVPIEKAADALRELRDEIERNNLKVNFVTEIRFVKGDSIWLSPANGRDSCYIGGYLYGNNRWSGYLARFESIMKKHGGRPHWGKEFSPELHDFGKMYPKWTEFKKLIQESGSPGRFENSLMEKIFAKDG
jgi:sugar-1,4-lactone oxidase-like protein